MLVKNTLTATHARTKTKIEQPKSVAVWDIHSEAGRGDKEGAAAEHSG